MTTKHGMLKKLKGNALSRLGKQETQRQLCWDAWDAVQVFNTNCHGMLVKLSITKY